MTQEKKARAYDKALERARIWKDKSGMPKDKQGILDDIFPELKESKDEKIRKAVIEMIHDTPNVECEDNYNVYKEDVLAWLEKQGKKQPIIVWHSINEEPEEMKELFCEWESDDATWHDVAFYDKESHTFQHAKMPINVTKWVYVDELLEKQGEQKPADKVEPKFHKGDWVVTSYGKVNQVIAVDEDCDGFTLDDDTYFSGSWKDSFHLWTIQDAKDGDVLVCPIPKTYDSAGQIFMFKGINSRIYVDNCIEFYCRVYEGVFYENENGYGYMGTTSSLIYPATKEQRETLIKAMTDAGYTFDFENKELKKIAPSNKELEGKV